MGFTIWLSVLCLQASLLSHALDCSAATCGEPCVSEATADGQHDEDKQRSVLPLTDALAPLRRRRQLEHRGPAHPNQARLPGAVTVRGFPNTLIQADRTRQHVVLTANKKKSKRKSKSRAGSFSLLSNDKKSTPLQVIRAKRGMKVQLSKRGSSGRSGAFSVLGDPQSNGQTDRPNTSTLGMSGAK
ncbi:uncharacterized protein si:dkey-12l12.1 [Takifugu flavidus]|uniref:Uncharacterized protein n=2 Tax=Takifugu TaxID=31032 RepID=A0A5C6NX00_9TELE|nr:uncharacterized protein si:dkey-12l12.1 [Takifugu flavidus]TNM96195.1 hypothetical protein fugu_015856 [Takifugu bimaculatus]TWW71121.1 hypothetical protein D4764_17G0006040 [Takifugu flavidus]